MIDSNVLHKIFTSVSLLQVSANTWLQQIADLEAAHEKLEQKLAASKKTEAEAAAALAKAEAALAELQKKSKSEDENSLTAQQKLQKQLAQVRL